MTVDEVRQIALSLPEVVEGAHHGHPDFRIGKSIFATLWPDKKRSVVRIPAPVAEAQEDGDRIRIVSRQGDTCWLAAQLDSVQASDWQPMIELAHQIMITKRAKT